MPELDHYHGREQAYVKHTFLESYLDGLLYKVGARYDEIAYVDGFAGPWQSANEEFADTSFGLALERLRRAKAELSRRGRTVQMKAVLVEADAAAFERLRTVPDRYRDLVVRTIHGNFNQSISQINAELGRAFSFVFIDPKGWSVDLAAVGNLISRENCEVVFNFMFDFVNRFAEVEAARETLDRLFVGVDNWIDRIRDAPDRKAEVYECFREALSNVGRYRFCLSTDVLKVASDRVHYALFYGTRHPKGVQVFRDTQVKALEAEASMRADLRQQRDQTRTQQNELFSLHEMSPNQTQDLLARERTAAASKLLALSPLEPTTANFGEVATRIMTENIVRRTDLGTEAATLRKEGRLQFSPWPPRKQKPEDDFRVWRPAQV